MPKEVKVVFHFETDAIEFWSALVWGARLLTIENGGKGNFSDYEIDREATNKANQWTEPDNE